MKKIFIFIAMAVSLVGCGSRPLKTADESFVPAAFSPDSAYAFIQAQTDMGARVPGSVAHRQCLDYLSGQLQRLGWQVDIQQGSLPNYADEQQIIHNIVGSYRPDITRGRILLCAHWDSRPWCDQEEDEALWTTPVLGANDGASGVGVLLEIARQMQLQQPEIGVDIVFFDAEDMGAPAFYKGEEQGDAWCLGSQLWATANKERRQDYAYGILLDMVGSEDAVFSREYYSMQFASAVVGRIWKMAGKIGHNRYFVYQDTYPVLDDHYYINSIAGIPTADIIHYDRRSGSGFPDYWHTTHDDLSHVSKPTLLAVGQTVLTLLLTE